MWVMEHGLAGLSLRPLAQGIGTSDRMLVYYFGSKDGLVAAITEFAGEQLVAAMPTIDSARPPRSARAWLDQAWALFSDPAVRPAMQLLFELDALAARSPGPAREAAAAVTAQWLAIVDDVLAELGVPARSRSGLAPTIAAALIGLALEELITGAGSAPQRFGPWPRSSTGRARRAGSVHNMPADPSVVELYPRASESRNEVCPVVRRPVWSAAFAHQGGRQFGPSARLISAARRA